MARRRGRQGGSPCCARRWPRTRPSGSRAPSVLAAMLRDARRRRRDADAAVARGAPCTRFVALPLRVLRPDPDTDFLAFSVPDAVSVALAALESVIVRSPQARVRRRCRRPRDRPRSCRSMSSSRERCCAPGGHVRVSAQLADAAAGTLIWSDVAQAPIEDLFQLQDTLTTRIVSSLSLPLTARDRHVARSARAGQRRSVRAVSARERAGDAIRRGGAKRAICTSARSRSIPSYAPAWARLGRAGACSRSGAATAASGCCRRPRRPFAARSSSIRTLSIAHDLAAYVDAELGRAPEAMERLLARAARTANDHGRAGRTGHDVPLCRAARSVDGRAPARGRCSIRRRSRAWLDALHAWANYAPAIQADTGTPPYCAMLAQLLIGEMTLDAVREDGARTRASPGARLAVGAYRAHVRAAKSTAAMRQLDDAARVRLRRSRGLVSLCVLPGAAAARTDAALDYWRARSTAATAATSRLCRPAGVDGASAAIRASTRWSIARALMLARRARAHSRRMNGAEDLLADGARRRRALTAQSRSKPRSGFDDRFLLRFLQRFLEPLRERVAARLLILDRLLEQRLAARRLLGQDALRFVQLRPIGIGRLAMLDRSRPRLVSTTSTALQHGHVSSSSLFNRAMIADRVH